MDFYIVDAKTGKNRGSVVMDPFDDISVEEIYDQSSREYHQRYGEIVVDDDITDEEYDQIAEDAENERIHSLIEASRDVADAKQLLVRALEQLYLLGYDSGFTNPEIEQLVTDIKFYLNGGKLNG